MRNPITHKALIVLAFAAGFGVGALADAHYKALERRAAYWRARGAHEAELGRAWASERARIAAAAKHGVAR